MGRGEFGNARGNNKRRRRGRGLDGDDVGRWEGICIKTPPTPTPHWGGGGVAANLAPDHETGLKVFFFVVVYLLSFPGSPWIHRSSN